MDWSNPVQVKTEDLLTPKEEPIDTSFIKTENIEERPFVISGIVETLKEDKDVIKKECIESQDLPQKDTSSLIVS